jgi:hypothetical protein
MRRRLIAVSTALAVLALLSADRPPPELPPAATTKIDFARDIRPILQTRCLECHGPTKRKGELRLDDGPHALKGGASGPVIVPGKSASSRLVRLVAGLERDKRMPPKGAPLTAAEVGKLRAWIDQGAHWPKDASLAGGDKHWSFQPIRRPALPKVKNTRWPRNEIDHFILARLEADGISPSPEADRAALLRRLSLDLIGLPPSPDEIDKFLADKSDDAYEKQVDRLLALPHFGENWGRHWLDLARYADSDGYEKDLLRPYAWRWRDWVIDAINRDLPYDRFTIEQIAGDLSQTERQRDGETERQKDKDTAREGGRLSLSPSLGLAVFSPSPLTPRPSSLIATGFHRNTLVNHEGGIDVEEDRVKAVVDRTSTIGAVWLGLTVGCAECHAHKYDPISQREFYQLYAFFNNTADRDIIAPLPADAEQTEKRNAELADARKKYLEANAADKDFEAWRKKIAALPEIWKPIDSFELPTFTGTDGVNLYPQEDGSFLVKGAVINPQEFLLMGNTRLQGITGIRLEAMTDEMLPNFGPGYDQRGNFVLSEFHVEASPLSAVTQLKKVPIDKAVADYATPEFEIGKALDNDIKTGWGVDIFELPMHGVDRCALFLPKESIGHEAGTRLKISLIQKHNFRMALGRFRVMLTTAERDKILEQVVPERIRRFAALPREQQTADQQATLLRYYHATFKRDNDSFEEYTKALSEWLNAVGGTRAQVIVERATPRKTHVHVRGDFLRPGDEVAPEVPAVLPPLRERDFAHPSGAKQAPTRLDLAKWLVDSANPLTARVEVNRTWYHLFGEGLVTSLADFGTQGDLPSHPELLDWLADEFMRLKWSRKALIKKIVMSATYRQSSEHRPELVQRDARNRLLARQNRFRLPAELVRDQHLSAAALLNPEIGGASLPITSKRRGLYVQYKRTTPEYMLATFDKPSSTVTCPMRARSNTPLQALTLLNDPLMMECAQGLARRVFKEAKRERDQWLRYAFRVATARTPDDAELKSLRELFERVEKVYAEDDKQALELAGKDMPLDVARSEAAALVVVARVALNLDETVMRP